MIKLNSGKSLNRALIKMSVVSTEHITPGLSFCNSGTSGNKGPIKSKLTLIYIIWQDNKRGMKIEKTSIFFSPNLQCFIFL